ncbi:hypothetical protein BU24DRAFT_426205 [Aaosphaeria arxii CBS 175.79]|uniref:Localizes primarily to the nucleolus n=1 Tax=Aaosphaeria arxii CBS 175.79 TaxID=1450172 RepID=A0A6A5XJ47_9PLEO|nr:uncharacterized protein BU24DRAFT_426205 [Aaosphaeria arxii CBS 175.79]KAF2012334.1 hypothetical protein BU24DRAFT_426205 [Aaosphaeria arxii CBS 175.79]
MAVDNSLSALLSTLTISIKSATQVLPEDGTAPPKDGISLLDVKNDLLLSYLQNLVFLILLKLRNRSHSDKSGDDDLQEEIVKKLVELRVYLEKGVRPLENKLRYQIDKIVRTADDATRKESHQVTAPRPTTRQLNGDNSDISDDDSVGSAQTDDDMDETSYGPNLSAFKRSQAADAQVASETSKDGIYRPPRITPMAMPVTQSREERESRPRKSATMDEFIATELSTAPLAEPSIGSTIVSGGRRMKSDKERRDEAERRDYEESNFVRLPKESKKERAKKGIQSRNSGWGGEEFRNLGAGLDRIEKLTKRKGNALGSLERSRKRPVEDSPRGTGVVGDAFEKRRKVVSRYRK